MAPNTSGIEPKKFKASGMAMLIMDFFRKGAKDMRL